MNLIGKSFRIPWDLRKVDHYECYDEFDWEVMWLQLCLIFHVINDFLKLLVSEFFLCCE